MKGDTVKRRELAWKNITIRVQNVLFPLIQTTNTEKKLLLQVPENNESPDKDVIMADSNKIKELNTSHALNHTIKAYMQCHTAQKKNKNLFWPKL